MQAEILVRSRFPGVSALASLVQQHIFKTDPLCKAQSFSLTYKLVWIFTEASSVRLSEASPINTNIVKPYTHLLRLLWYDLSEHEWRIMDVVIIN